MNPQRARSAVAAACRPYGFSRLRVARRHVDLLRVNSAQCPGAAAVR